MPGRSRSCNAGWSSVGSLYRPASRITGVASRKAKRAASSRLRPLNRPAAMVAPERLRPGNRPAISAAPTVTATFVLSRDRRTSLAMSGGSSRPCLSSSRTVGSPRTRALAPSAALLALRAALLRGVEHQAVDHQEDARVDRFAERGAQQFVQHDAGQADRDGAEHEQPRQLLVRCPDLLALDRADQTAHDPDPVVAEEERERQRRRHVQGHDQRQIGRVRVGHAQVAGPGSADEGRDQHGVPEAGDREELRDALHQAEQYRLGVVFDRGQRGGER